MMEQEIIKSIKNLPIIPDTVYQMQRVCSDPRSSIADVIKIVEKDPILTANLLRAANSPLYGFSREVSNISQAVSLFGMSTVKGFAIVTAVKSRVKINLSPYGVNEKGFLRTADLQNAFMTRWMSKVDRDSLDLLAPASFLLEIGVVILSSVLLQQGKNKEFMGLLDNRGEMSVIDVEKNFFGISSYEAASILFEYWNFDVSLVEVMRYVEKPKNAPANLIKYAYILAILQRLISLYEVCADKQIKQATKLLEEGGLDGLLFEQTVHDFCQSIHD